MYSVCLFLTLFYAVKLQNYDKFELMNNIETNFRENANLVDCLTYTIQSFVFRSTIVLFEDEVRSVPWIDSFLERLQLPKLIIKRGQNVKNIIAFYVLFPENGRSYAGLFRGKNHVSSKFILVWDNIETSILSNVFNEFWNSKRIQVVGLVKFQKSNVLKLYSFFPYSEHKCGTVGLPILVATWNNSFHKLHILTDFFIEDMFNFNGCVLRAVGNHKPPDNIMLFNKTTKKWVAKGAGMNVLAAAEKYFNFTTEISAPELGIDLNFMWYYASEELNYIFEVMDRELVDFAFGWFSYGNVELDNVDSRVDLGSVTSIDCFGWVVPYRAGAKPPNSAYYTREFSNITWILIFITLLMTSIILYVILNPNNFSTAMFLTVQTFLEQPIVITFSVTYSFRILVFNFCFYSLVISAAYRASFASFITISLHGKEFTTPADILNSHLKIYGSPEIYTVLKAITVESNFTRKIRENFNILQVTDYETIMKRVIRQRDIAVLGVKRNLYFHSISEAKRLNVKIPFRFIPGCLIRPHTTHLIFKKGSFLIKPFNIFLNRLFESGIISNWILHLGTNKILPTERFKGRVIQLKFLKDVFYILVLGYFISGAVLIIEIYVNHNNKRKSTVYS